MRADMIDCNQLQSNLSLPFGKARMGYPTGKVRMGQRLGGGWCQYSS